MVIVAGSFLYSNAQLSVHLNANIGVQPAWAPVGYDRADYYYIPDIETYYSVSRRRYVYQRGNRWIFSSSLPPRYRNFDIYHAHKVVINEPDPYFHHEENRRRYAEFRGRHDQEIIRESNDAKYYENRYHPKHREWEREHREDHRHHD